MNNDIKPSKQQEEVFEIFKTLPNPEKYQGLLFKTRSETFDKQLIFEKTESDGKLSWCLTNLAY